MPLPTVGLNTPEERPLAGQNLPALVVVNATGWL